MRSGLRPRRLIAALPVAGLDRATSEPGVEADELSPNALRRCCSPRSRAPSSPAPSSLVGSTPHLVTLLVLTAASQRLRPPAPDDQPYRRGQQT